MNGIRHPLRSTASLALGILLALGACAAAEKNPASNDPKQVVVSGLLTLKGSEPGTWYAITDSAGEIWECVGLTAELRSKMAKLQNQKVRATGADQGRQIFRQLRVDDVTVVAPPDR